MAKCSPDCNCGRHTRPPGQRGREFSRQRASRKYARNHREYYLKHKLLSRYGLTPEELEEILAFQGGACALCGRAPKPGGKRLSVDHDHRTGLTRGLLCWRCNTGLGKFGDDPLRLRAAAEYLERPPATEALGRATFGMTGRSTRRVDRKRLRTGPGPGKMVGEAERPDPDTRHPSNEETEP